MHQQIVEVESCTSSHALRSFRVRLLWGKSKGSCNHHRQLINWSSFPNFPNWFALSLPRKTAASTLSISPANIKMNFFCLRIAGTNTPARSALRFLLGSAVPQKLLNSVGKHTHAAGLTFLSGLTTTSYPPRWLFNKLHTNYQSCFALSFSIHRSLHPCTKIVFSRYEVSTRSAPESFFLLLVRVSWFNKNFNSAASNMRRRSTQSEKKN